MEPATYDLVMRTPLGAKKGRVTFEEGDGDALYATMSALGKTERVEGTRNCNGNGFAFAGTATTPLGATDYEVTGTADGTSLAALCKTRKGNFKVTGKRAR